LYIGCAYGGLIYELMKNYSTTNFEGIDPGKKSIEIANKNIQSKRVTFIKRLFKLKMALIIKEILVC
jgi:tRNA G46 methylase TrmB